MSDYAVFFSGTTTLRLPTNPEEIEVTYSQANEKFEVLKLGQIVIPTHVELRQFSFECEFPHAPTYYCETPNEFKNPDEYLKIFTAWQNYKKPIRFIASNGVDEEINTEVLIETMTVVEKAGEEGDKYITFKLIEYKNFRKEENTVTQEKTTLLKTQMASKPKVSNNPKKPKTYTIVKGDTLWGIAKRFYGSGSQYNKIYNANKGKVKNPNLIYPGMVITLP